MCREESGKRKEAEVEMMEKARMVFWFPFRVLALAGLVVGLVWPILAFGYFLGKRIEEWWIGIPFIFAFGIIWSLNYTFVVGYWAYLIETKCAK